MPEIRRGSADDRDAVVALFDENVRWLVARGRASQWGESPWSQIPARVEFVGELLSSGEVMLAVRDGEVMAASVVSTTPMPYVDPLPEPERYLRLLISSPRSRGDGLGAALIRLAKDRTTRDGAAVLRVDCWAGGDGRLVAYYQSQDFIPDRRIEVRPDAVVQLLTWRPGSDPDAVVLCSS